MEKILERENTVIHLVCVTIEWPYALAMLKSIAEQQVNSESVSKTNVVACIETKVMRHEELLPPGVLPDGMQPNDITTVVYRLQNGQWTFVELLKDFNLRYHVHLTRFFRDIIIGRHPAKRYLLFTWGHGSTYTTFSNNGGVVENTVIGPSIPHLTMEHLSRAIIDSSTHIKRFKIDVVVMINCFMQQIEAGYELYLAGTDYLVAPENFGSWDGYDYALLTRSLFLHPDMSSEAFAKLAVDSLENYNPPGVHNTPQSVDEQRLKDSAFVAVKIHQYGELFRLTDRLALALLALGNDDIRRFMFNASGMQDTSRKRTVDLVKLLQIMRNTFNGTHTAVSGAIDEIMGFLRDKNVVLSVFIGQNEHGASYNGISISYIRKASQGIDHHHYRFMQRRSPFASSFAKTNAWGAFAERYIPLLQ
jgi:hypothetical protein